MLKLIIHSEMISFLDISQLFYRAVVMVVNMVNTVVNMAVKKVVNMLVNTAVNMVVNIMVTMEDQSEVTSIEVDVDIVLHLFIE